MNSQPLNRRRFLTAAGAGSALATLPLAAAPRAPDVRLTTGLVDCQSHLFFPEVLDLMRRRKTEPLVYDPADIPAARGVLIPDEFARRRRETSPPYAPP